MENKKLTAVQELIHIYEEHKKNKGSLYGFVLTKKLQKKLLELEKKQHNRTYLDGAFEMELKTNKSFGDYYDENYGNK